MSMSLLTAFQFLETLFAYLFVTIAIPAVVFGRKISHYRFAKRIMCYYIVGSFYATNLVFVLQFLHISNFFTLWIGLLVVPAGAWCYWYHYPLKEKLRSFFHSFRKFVTGSLGFKSIVHSLWGTIWLRFKRGSKKVFGHLWRNWIDWLLIAGVALLMLWVYGVRMVNSFGFSASDMPVHLYWVNGLSDNKPFVDGIYPFGMHCIAYLLGTAFRIDSYVVLRVFALLQCVGIHIVALLFLRLCCKSRFTAYSGVVLYIIGNYFTTNNFARYLSALPQEYSMLFIFPTAYFAFSFFKHKRRELKEDLPAKESRLALYGLAMSFSLALAGHFYGAMIAGLFCIGIAAGYFLWIFRPTYLKRIVIAGLISVLIAAIPMGIAFATGKPLQGSLYWGTNMITGSTQTQSSSSETASTETSADSAESAETSVDSTAEPQESADTTASAAEVPVVAKPGLMERLRHAPEKLWDAVGARLQTYILRQPEDWHSVAIRGMILFLIVAGAVFLIFPVTRSYGAMVLSVGAFMAIMSILLAATALGLPALMGADRTCIFYTYSLTILVSFTLDVCAYLILGLFKYRWPMEILSFAALITLVFGIWQQDRVRPSMTSNGLEMNEAITCLTNIIETEPDYKWTIFSANDETNMVYGHGYHYELSTFLHEIQVRPKDPVTVPTETVYFYIEKRPLDYAVSYEGSGQMISREGAKEIVPNLAGLGNYQGRNRWIIMSHMYYWAEEFRRLYPNEMKIYLETDRFICYRLEQNTYRLYDLAIDYGYNYGYSTEGR